MPDVTERRIGHVSLMDVPDHPRQLLLTDVAIDVSPTLSDKVGSIQNGIDLAHILGIAQPRAAIIVLPDLEAGSMLTKQSTFLSGAEAAGVVPGARGLIVLASRSDSARTRMTSCTLGVVVAQAGDAT